MEKRTLNFGKIAYVNPNRKDNPVEVTIELRQRGGDDIFTIENGDRVYTGEKTPVYSELSICGDVWNRLHTDIYCGGQCLDTIAEYVKTPLFKEVYKLWKKYHLNGMHAGTPEQEKLLDGFKAKGWRYDYSEACALLKDAGLYEVPFYGLTVGKKWNGELYTYGHGWIVQELPKEIENRVREIIENGK